MVRRYHDFFASLVARRFATSYAAAHRRAHIYHLHSKLLYAAIGEPNNRNRKPVTLARAVERLMVLDTVLAEPRLRWLGSGREKVEYFKAATTLRLKELPHLAFGRGAEKTIRHFPDKLPIGVAADGRTHVFLYLVNRPTPVDFRAFLHRHAELLRALPEWELRLLVPRHMVKAVPLFEDAARERDEPALASGRRRRASLVLQAAGPSRSRRRAQTISSASGVRVERSERLDITSSIGSGRRTATSP